MNEINNTVVDGQSAQDAKPGESSAPATNQGVENSASGAAKSTETQIPFHKNPDFQDYIGRQKKSWDREWNQKLESERNSWQKELQEIKSQFQKTTGQSLSEQDASQLRQLAKLMQSDTESAKILGLDSLKALRDEIESLKSSSSEQAIEREAGSVVNDYAKKFGYEPQTLEKELWEFIKDDDYWSQQPFSKGIFAKATRDFFSDKQQELAERAANMKLVTEQKEKTRVGSQKPVGNAQQGQEQPKTMREFLSKSFKAAADKEGVAFGS